MAKYVTGYLATDGTYFEHQAAAEFHDAQQELTRALEDAQIDSEEFINILAAHFTLISRWCDSHRDANLVNGHAHDTGADEKAEAIQQLATHGFRDVPNVWGGTHEEDT